MGINSMLEDRIHGYIEITEDISKIMESDFFSRLKKIKQLGVVSAALPALKDVENNTRYEHSLGVCHLVAVFLKVLQENREECFPDERFFEGTTKKLVQIAGLLHDVGHGPFSHFWETVVHLGVDKEWTHEKSSARIAEQILRDAKICNQSEIEIVKALITGDRKTLKESLCPDKMFISEIVNNSVCKIDVDKWDYLQRDYYHIHNRKMETKFRFFYNAKVVKEADDDYSRICFNYNDECSIFDLFNMRSRMHAGFYQHIAVLKYEILLIRIFIEAERAGFLFLGVKLSEAHLDLNVYKHLDDSILDVIASSEDSNLAKTQELIQKYKNSNTNIDSLVQHTIDEAVVKNIKNDKNYIVRARKIDVPAVPDNVLFYGCDQVVDNKKYEYNQSLDKTFYAYMKIE